MNNTLRKGFTLLEMMLVIVVIAIIAVAVIQVLSKQTSEAKVDKTATEIQMLLTAARNYYNKQPSHVWPTSVEQLAAAYQLNSSGAFGAYTLNYAPGFGSGNNGDARPKSESITISVVTPNPAIAQALVHQLPLAAINASNALQVDAMASNPGSSAVQGLLSYMQQHHLIMIKSIYTDLIGKDVSNLHDHLSANTFNALILPTCPTGWTPGYDLALTQMLWGQGGIHADHALRYYSLCKTQYNFTPADSGTTTHYTSAANLAASGGTIWHAASVLVITYCMPPSVTTGNVNLLNKYNYDNSRTSQLINYTGNNAASSCYFGPFTGANG